LPSLDHSPVSRRLAKCSESSARLYNLAKLATCSEQHVPGFIENYDKLKSKGVNYIICVSVIDGFVMNAFAKVVGSTDKVIMAGDGSAAFTSALGLTQDLTKNGMGIRSKRFAIVVNDLVVEYVGVESAPGTTVSGAEAVLAKL
jgi:peroxiredoxin